MADLFANRARTYLRRPPGREPTPVRTTAPGRALQGLGRDMAQVGLEQMTVQQRQGVAQDMATYEAAKNALFQSWEQKRHAENIVDDDGSQFEAFAKQHENDLFGNLRWRDAQDRARNDWTTQASAAKLDYAAEGLKRRAVELDGTLLATMQQAQELPPGFSEAMVGQSIATIRRLSAEGFASGAPHFRSEAVNKVREEQAIKSVVAQYLDDKNDPGIYDRANEVLADLYGDDLPGEYGFTAEEVTALKKGYQSRVNAAETQRNHEKTQAADALYDEVATHVLRGVLSRTVEGATPQPYREIVLNDENLTGPQKHTLVDMIDAAAKGPTEASALDKLNAYIEIVEEPDYDKKKVLLAKYANILGGTRPQTIYDDLRDPAKGDETLIADMKTTVSSMRDIELAAIKKSGGDVSEMNAQIAAMDAKYSKLKAKAYLDLQEHPEYTQQQRIDAIQKALTPVTEDVARTVVSWRSRLWKQRRNVLGAAGLYSFGEMARPLVPEAEKEKERVTATNPNTGERVYWDGSKWQPLQ